MIDQLNLFSRRRCAVITDESADAAEAYDLLASVAGSLDLDLILVAETIAPGDRITDIILRDLRTASVVLIVLSDSPSPTFWFRVGLASASGLPTVIVETGPGALIPSDMAGQLRVGPTLSASALGLAITRAIQPSTSVDRSRESAVLSGSALGDESTTRLLRLLGSQDLSLPADATWGARAAINFETWFADLLASSEVAFQRPNTTPSDLGADFVVAASELDGNLGPLVAIELVINKNPRVRSSLVRTRLSRFERYRNLIGANSLLVVSRYEDRAPEVSTLNAGTVLYVGAELLVAKMRTETFGSAVLSLRNAAVHAITQ